MLDALFKKRGGFGFFTWESDFVGRVNQSGTRTNEVVLHTGLNLVPMAETRQSGAGCRAAWLRNADEG